MNALSRFGVLFLSVLLASSAVAQQAQAEEEAAGPVAMEEGEMNTDVAKEHFKLGQSFYDAGRFKEAAEEWEKAYELSPKDALLYNVYVARRDSGDRVMAAGSLKRYLATPGVDPGDRINLEARLKVMEEQIAAQQATEAQAAEPVAESEPQPDAQTAPPPEETDLVPYVLMGAGGVMIVGGVVTGLIANGKVSDIEDACPNDTCPTGFDLEGERDSARTVVTVTDILLIGGAAVGAIGVVLFLVDEKESSSAGIDTPTLACGVSGCMTSVTGRF